MEGQYLQTDPRVTLRSQKHYPPPPPVSNRGGGRVTTAWFTQWFTTGTLLLFIRRYFRESLDSLQFAPLTVRHEYSTINILLEARHRRDRLLNACNVNAYHAKENRVAAAKTWMLSTCRWRHGDVTTVGGCASIIVYSCSDPRQLMAPRRCVGSDWPSTSALISGVPGCMCACGEHACDARTRRGWHPGRLPASMRACVRQAARARSRRHRFDYQALQRPARRGRRGATGTKGRFRWCWRTMRRRRRLWRDETTDEPEPEPVPSATLARGACMPPSVALHRCRCACWQQL